MNISCDNDVVLSWLTKKYICRKQQVSLPLYVLSSFKESQFDQKFVVTNNPSMCTLSQNHPFYHINCYFLKS